MSVAVVLCTAVGSVGGVTSRTTALGSLWGEMLFSMLFFVVSLDLSPEWRRSGVSWVITLPTRPVPVSVQC